MELHVEGIPLTTTAHEHKSFKHSQLLHSQTNY